MHQEEEEQDGALSTANNSTARRNSTSSSVSGSGSISRVLSAAGDREWTSVWPYALGKLGVGGANTVPKRASSFNRSEPLVTTSQLEELKAQSGLRALPEGILGLYERLGGGGGGGGVGGGLGCAGGVRVDGAKDKELQGLLYASKNDDADKVKLPEFDVNRTMVLWCGMTSSPATSQETVLILTETVIILGKQY